MCRIWNFWMRYGRYIQISEGTVRYTAMDLRYIIRFQDSPAVGDEKKVGVVINEAVELTKKYGADEDYQFVNGLLGTVAREQGLDTAEDAASEEP